MKVGDSVWVVHKITNRVEQGVFSYTTKQGEIVVELDRGHAGFFNINEIFITELEALYDLDNRLLQKYDEIKNQLDEITLCLDGVYKRMDKIEEEEEKTESEKQSL